jgi:hypothetical protein
MAEQAGLIKALNITSHPNTQQAKHNFFYPVAVLSEICLK